jgi:hypothetical protein
MEHFAGFTDSPRTLKPPEKRRKEYRKSAT